MTDENKALRDFLLTDATLVALVSTRIYGGCDTPAAGYKPSDGGCICFKVRGGTPDYSDLLVDPSVQFKCYGATAVNARAVYLALYGALHQAKGAVMRHAWCDVLGQDLTEPETGWPYVLTFFTVRVAND